MNYISETEQAISKLLDLTQELIFLNKFEEADRFLNEIERHKPDEINVSFQRGTLFMQKQEYDKALLHFKKVYERSPDVFVNLNNMGTCYYKIKQYDNAIVFYQKALSLKPDVDFVLSMTAVCLSRRGRLDESISYFHRALGISPNMNSTHSDLLLTMLYAESVSPEDLVQEAIKFGKNITSTFTQKPCVTNKLIADRKLKIGYVSPDFRDHPVRYFLEHLIRNHDRQNFEIYAFSNTKADNPIMEMYKKTVDYWHDIKGLDDDQACNFIRSNQIDILVDVAGHTAWNRLGIFARRAAPVQVTWLGFPATSGLPAMDYRITDNYAEPVGMTEHLNIETLWRLPSIFCCYQQHESSPDVIDHPPFEDNDYITFGCFNNFIKVRDPVLAVWARILEKVPQSRLLLEIEGIDEPDFRNLVIERMRKQNCPLDRIILEPRRRENQFSLYNKIDIALDPFPCCGGTTSMDALWMGVPLITLAGVHFASRMGVTILSNINLEELIAQNTDEYITIAVNLALDQKRLKTMRYNLRGRFAKSPAMDQMAFASDMEHAYKEMWRKYSTQIKS